MSQADKERILEEIRDQIEEERRKRALVENSISDLKRSVARFDKQGDENESYDDGTEWKIRHDTQLEYNEYLNKQISQLRDRVERAKESKTSEMVKNYSSMHETDLILSAKRLEQRKLSLLSELKDYEWRLDQESKAFHKANEERKRYSSEISHTKSYLNQRNLKERTMTHSQKEDNDTDLISADSTLPTIENSSANNPLQDAYTLPPASKAPEPSRTPNNATRGIARGAAKRASGFAPGSNRAPGFAPGSNRAPGFAPGANRALDKAPGNNRAPDNLPDNTPSSNRSLVNNRASRNAPGSQNKVIRFSHDAPARNKNGRGKPSEKNKSREKQQSLRNRSRSLDRGGREESGYPQVKPSVRWGQRQDKVVTIDMKGYNHKQGIRRSRSEPYLTLRKSDGPRSTGGKI